MGEDLILAVRLITRDRGCKRRKNFEIDTPSLFHYLCFIFIFPNVLIGLIFNFEWVRLKNLGPDSLGEAAPLTVYPSSGIQFVVELPLPLASAISQEVAMSQ